jgi:hypothetical protein
VPPRPPAQQATANDHELLADDFAEALEATPVVCMLECV